MIEESSLCRKCEKWTLVEGDNFCSWCGAALFDLKLQADRSRIFAPLGAKSGKSTAFASWDKSKAREIAVAADGTGLAVGLRLKNLGQWPAKVEVAGDKEWLRFSDSAPMLEAGQEIDVKSVIDTSQAPVAEISKITITASSDRARDEIELDLVPVPDIQAELNSHVLYLDDGRETVTGRIILKAGLLEPEAGESIEADVPWARASWQNPDQIGTGQWRAHTELPFELDIDKSRLAKDVLRGDSAKPVRLAVKDKNFGFLDTLQFNVALRWPPMIDLLGADHDEVSFRVLAGREQQHAIDIRNVGDEELMVYKIEPQVEGEVAWLSVDVQGLPISLGPGESTAVTLKAGALDLENGSYTGSLLITSDSFESAAKRVEVRCHVFEQEYEGIVAVDFGTTNSCVVVFNPDDADATVIELDQGKLTALLSVILYEKLEAADDGDKPKRVYRVGTYADNMAGDPKAQESFVRSVKRDLGKPMTYSIRFRQDGQKVDLAPEDVAGDIVAYIIDKVEEELQQKITTCVITHPSRFSPVQLNSLRQTFEKHDIKVTSMVHEPVGAALDYIISTKNNGGYTILVCDFGGGTTDFAVLRVNDQADNGNRLLKVQVLGATACHRFGGDDVTEAVAGYIAEQGAKQLEDKKQNVPADMFLPREDILAIRDMDERRRALMNRETIRRAAEKVKIKCSENPKSSEIISVTVEGAGGTVTFEVELAADILNDLARENIAEAVEVAQDLLARVLEDSKLDVVLVAGRASQLPQVQKSLAVAFTESPPVFAGTVADELPSSDKLKQCVAKGAARFENIKSSRGAIKIKATDMKDVATAAVGIKWFDESGRACFQPIIACGEALGVWKPVPDPEKKLKLYENIGNDNRLDMVENNRRFTNPDIRELDTFDLRAMADSDGKDLKVDIQLSKVHKVLLRINGKVQESSQVYG